MFVNILVDKNVYSSCKQLVVKNKRPEVRDESQITYWLNFP